MLIINSLIDFICNSFFLTGYITNSNTFPLPLDEEEEEKYEKSRMLDSGVNDAGHDHSGKCICSGRYGRYEDGRYRPFPLFSPPSRVEERGEFDSGVFDRHLWSLCVSCNSSGCMCREVVYLIHQEIR